MEGKGESGDVAGRVEEQEPDGRGGLSWEVEGRCRISLEKEAKGETS